MPDRGIRHDTLHGAIRLGNAGFGLLAVTVGMTLALQTPTRMSTPGWEVALSLPGLDAKFWGIYMMIGGLLMLTAIPLQHRGRALVVLGSGAVAFALWGRAVAAFLALSEPNASGTAPQFFTAIAVVYLANSIIHARPFAR